MMLQLVIMPWSSWTTLWQCITYRPALTLYFPASFIGARLVIVGVSPDTSQAQAKFKTKFSLPFTLLADSEHKTAEDYGVWKEKSMYGKKYMGAARTTFIIDESGRIEHVFEKVKPEGHDQEVLTHLRGSGSTVNS